MPPAQLTLFEHEFRAYADIPGLPKAASARDSFLDSIDRINQAAGRAILQADRKGLRAQDQVGVLHVGSIGIEILPKIDNPGDAPAGASPGSGTGASGAAPDGAQSAAHNLLHMLACAHNIPVSEQDMVTLAAQPVAWFDLLIRLFAGGLYRQLFSGLSHDYTVQEETLPVLRGRWDIQRQVLRHGEQRHIFDVTYDAFSPDIPLNQVFRHVIHELRWLAQDTETRRLLGSLADWFQPVSELREITPALLESIYFNRLNARFEPSFNLARLFLSGSAVRPTRGDLPASGFVFDMNALFERFAAAFITRHAAKVLPDALRDAAVIPQGEGMRLYLARSEGQPVARLRPDLLFKRRGGSQGENPTLLIADTKYKRLDPAQRKAGVAPEDLYQMLAYSVRLNCPRILLLYPEPPPGGPIRKQFEIEQASARLSVCTINLRTPLRSPDPLIREMREVFEFALPSR